jgi:hypothetical protein
MPTTFPAFRLRSHAMSTAFAAFRWRAHATPTTFTTFARRAHAVPTAAIALCFIVLALRFVTVIFQLG